MTCKNEKNNKKTFRLIYDRLVSLTDCDCLGLKVSLLSFKPPRFISIFMHANHRKKISFLSSREDCSNMTRLSASCYAATKHGPGKDATVARVPKKEKSKSKNQMKHGEMETTVSLDKYNGKLMNSIWGLYNRWEGQEVDKFVIFSFCVLLATLRTTLRSRMQRALQQPLKDKRWLTPSSSHLLSHSRFPNLMESSRLRPLLSSKNRSLRWKFSRNTSRIFSTFPSSKSFQSFQNLQEIFLSFQKIL